MQISFSLFLLCCLMFLRVTASLKASKNLVKFAGINRLQSLKMSTGSGDTVVDRCTQKITDSLKPSQLIVTSSNDDPNGSHVSIIS